VYHGFKFPNAKLSIMSYDTLTSDFPGECLCLVHLSSSLAKTNSPSTITPTAWSCSTGQLKPTTTVIKNQKTVNI